MVTPELLTFIKQQIALGKTKEEIKAQLQASGSWLSTDIEEAFAMPEMSTAAPVSPVAAAPSATGSVVYAGFWRRFVALLVDGSILGLFSMVIALFFVLAKSTPSVTVLQLIFGSVGILYSAVLESSRWQGTVGKRLMGLTVTSTTGGRISFLRALGRTVAKIISAIPLSIGFLMAGFTAKKQGLHDMIAGTLVVKQKPAKVGLILLSIFGPMILSVVAGIVFASMIFGALGFGLGSFFGGIHTTPATSIQDTTSSSDQSGDEKDTVSDTTDMEDITPMTSKEYADGLASIDPTDFTLDKPGSYVGPGTVELKGFSSSSAAYDEIHVFLPYIPNLEKGKVILSLSHAYTTSGADVLDAKSSFETDEFFTAVDMYEKGSGNNTYYEGYRSVHYLGKDLTSKTLGSVEGVLTLELPATDGMYKVDYPFTIKK